MTDINTGQVYQEFWIPSLEFEENLNHQIIIERWEKIKDFLQFSQLSKDNCWNLINENKIRIDMHLTDYSITNDKKR